MLICKDIGVNRTDELILFDYGLSELCHRRFQEGSYYDGVITCMRGRGSFYVS